MSTPDTPGALGGGKCMWREWPLWAVLLLVVLVYYVRLDHLTIRGEESRRATVAMEMLATGDWIVPRQQGESRYMSSRPPLQNWMIAGVAAVRGTLDTVAVRLPSVVAITLLAMLIYFVARSFLSPVGACAASASYVTLGHVMELGRLGESDAVFTLFLGGGMLLWLRSYLRKAPPWQTWLLGYTGAVLATLTKGPQAPVYFCGGIGLFLLLNRDWRYAVSWAHAAGIALYTAVFAAGFVPFAMQVGWSGVVHTFSGDVTMYGNGFTFSELARHYSKFPMQLLAGWMPWTPLLAMYAVPKFRSQLGSKAKPALFCWCVLAVAVPTVALIPGTRPRFLMSVYPCVAVLVAIVVERAALAAQGTLIRRSWRWYLRGTALAMVLVGIGLPIAKCIFSGPHVTAQPWIFVAGFTWLSIGMALWAWQCAQADHAAWHIGGVLTVAAFAGLAFAGLFTNSLVYKSRRYDLAMAKLKTQLPPSAELVSVGPIPHAFAYYYGKPIELLPTGAEIPAPQAGPRYFCALSDVPINTPHQTIAEICLEREWDDQPQTVVVVGRLLSEPRQAKVPTQRERK